MTGLTKLLSGEGKPVAERGKDSIQLRLVTFIEQSAHIGARLDTQFEQMTAQDKRGGSLVHNFESARTLQQPGPGRKSVKGFGWAACVIGPRDAHKPVDSCDLPGQSPNRTVRGVRVMQRTGAEVAAHKRYHFIDEMVLVRQPFEKASRRGLSFRFVAARRDASKVGRGRRRFAEIVTEDAEADDQIVVMIAGAFPGKPVQAVECMDPDIAFRVPDGVLLAALERCEFRIEAESAAVAQELQTQ